ncbi:DUF1561 family protein, partial [Leptospira noguchii]|uniref:DUF1561 family protein n=1 Tax=Leptospira noguchii TaxID=28182 RepID=UPI0002BE75E0
RWGGSDKNTTPLYYNPESGHIAQYYPSSGSLYCMYSKMTDKYDWDWVKWALCSDAAISKDNPAFWNVFFETDEGGMITDYKGNILRVTRYGFNKGVAYAAKSSYLEKDTTHSPTSSFVVDKDLLDWTRYTSSNLGKTGLYCPAGNQESLGHKRVKRTLPPDFQLTEAWIRRLYNIATSNTQPVSVEEISSTCFLHSFQMLAELQEYHSQGPLQSGGYFFDTTPDTDPFVSFRLRYPELNILITGIPEIYGRITSSTRIHTYGFARAMLPQYLWNLSNELTTPTEIRSHVNGLFSNSAGSIWLAIALLQSRSGSLIWRAVPILRTSQGLVVIQTNLRDSSLDSYRQTLTPLINPSQVITNLMTQNTLIQSLITIELGHYYQNPLDTMISNNNCTGEGEDRRGTGENPTSTSVNQCASGRCTLISQ